MHLFETVPEAARAIPSYYVQTRNDHRTCENLSFEVLGIFPIVLITHRMCGRAILSNE
jgi:hypothetical protein